MLSVPLIRNCFQEPRQSPIQIKGPPFNQRCQTLVKGLAATVYHGIHDVKKTHCMLQDVSVIAQQGFVKPCTVLKDFMCVRFPLRTWVRSYVRVSPPQLNVYISRIVYRQALLCC